VRERFIKQTLKTSRHCDVEHFESENQIANLMIKSLQCVCFERLRDMMSLYAKIKKKEV